MSKRERIAELEREADTLHSELQWAHRVLDAADVPRLSPTDGGEIPVYQRVARLTRMGTSHDGADAQREEEADRDRAIAILRRNLDRQLAEVVGAFNASTPVQAEEIYWRVTGLLNDDFTWKRPIPGVTP